MCGGRERVATVTFHDIPDYIISTAAYIAPLLLVHIQSFSINVPPLDCFFPTPYWSIHYKDIMTKATTTLIYYSPLLSSD